MKLIVIDIQKGITDERLYNYDGFIKNVTSIIDAARKNNVLANYLRESKEKDLMIVGLQTNFCVDASVESAFERGYKVIVPKGTNSTFDNDYMDRETTYKYYNDMMWPERFASCISVDDAIKMIEDYHEVDS
ncbi:MAG: isochorismatase family protein [Butyrivibrio sp.]|nr:isochorismatase family protein [Butyrivibrio sp.]